MKAVVIYSSLTGNTEKVARALYESITFEKEIFKSSEEVNLEKYDLIAFGYWVNKGICDDKIKEMLENTHNREIVLFGTLGASDSGEYYESVKKRIEGLVPSDNKILGHFLCQGKISEALTERYKEILKKNPHDEHIKVQLKNHEEASSHPNHEDLEKAKRFIENIL